MVFEVLLIAPEDSAWCHCELQRATKCKILGRQQQLAGLEIF
jgi:hypothetical protein